HGHEAGRDRRDEQGSSGVDSGQGGRRAAQAAHREARLRDLGEERSQVRPRRPELARGGEDRPAAARDLSPPPRTSHGEPGAVAPGLSCGTCRACLSGRDNLCSSYGILGETRDGGCAEHVVIPARNMIALPDALGFPDAAAVSLVFLTAWHMLVDRAELRPG